MEFIIFAVRILISVGLFILAGIFLFRPRLYHLQRLRTLEKSPFYTKTKMGRNILEDAQMLAANKNETFFRIRIVGIVMLFFGCINLLILFTNNNTNNIQSRSPMLPKDSVIKFTPPKLDTLR